MKYGIAILILAMVFTAGCGRAVRQEPKGILFKDDVAFLKQHTQVVVLSSEDGRARVAVNPDLQGRVMTSTAAGDEGLSFGWINRELLASPENNVHMNAFGGEDRFWLGPEGGQFSIFFKKGEPFDLDHWFTPPPLNEGAYEIAAREREWIRFTKAIRLVNYSGTEFDLALSRDIRLLSSEAVKSLGVPLPEGITGVAYQSDNRITNTGSKPWTKDSGLLSIWILGMFNPSPETTIVVPFKPGPEAVLGPAVNDAYFGKVPANRLAVKNGVLFFSGDGTFRSKIGISPKRAKPFTGSYDAAHRVLTIVHLTIPDGAADYVNSMWEIQKEPFGGDVVNSYNDGPASPGAKPLGPFYEIESSSPAGALKPGETMKHVHTTMHFQGDGKALDRIARAVLGVGIKDIEGAFKK
jgi:hypothetical protein